MNRRGLQSERTPVDLLEEAFHLVRRASGGALAAYALGTLPFVLGLLYFWSDLGGSAFAEDHLIPGAAALCALFLWMKCWHSVFAGQILAQLCGEPPPRLTARRLLRIAAFQGAVQPFGLFVIFVSLPLFLPLAWTYAFFANATLFAAGETPNLRSLLRRSWRQCRLWPMQSQVLLFLFKLLGLFLFANLLAAVMAGPSLLKSFFGFESVFTRSPWAAFNTTLLATLGVGTWLLLDPILKGAYILRCFYGESLVTGQDLKAELRSIHPPTARRAVAVLLLLLVFIPSTSRAAPDAPALPGSVQEAQSSKSATRPPLPAPALDRSINEVIQRREFTWRSPREKGTEDTDNKNEKSGFTLLLERIAQGFKAVGRTLDDFVKWLFRSTPRPPGVPGGFSLVDAMRPVVFVLIVVLVVVIGWLLFRLWKNRTRPEVIVPEALAPAPDLNDESVGADQLPEDGWMRLARELLARGELRPALRAFYLSSLAFLATRQFITLARHKSNRDYERELLRRGHALSSMGDIFGENVNVFERVWYGAHDVNSELVHEFAGKVERIKGMT